MSDIDTKTTNITDNKDSNEKVYPDYLKDLLMAFAPMSAEESRFLKNPAKTRKGQPKEVEEKTMNNYNIKKQRYVNSVDFLYRALCIANINVIKKINKAIAESKSSYDAAMRKAEDSTVFNKAYKEVRREYNHNNCKALKPENSYMMFSNYVRKPISQSDESIITITTRMSLMGKVWKTFIIYDSDFMAVLEEKKNQLNEYKLSLIPEFDASEKRPADKDHMKDLVAAKRDELLQDLPDLKIDKILTMIHYVQEHPNCVEEAAAKAKAEGKTAKNKPDKKTAVKPTKAEKTEETKDSNKSKKVDKDDKTKETKEVKKSGRVNRKN